MSRMDVPGSIRGVLEPGEEIFGKTGNSERDFYATDSRILVFERPSWLVWIVTASFCVLIFVIHALGWSLWLALFCCLLGGLVVALTKKSSLKDSIPYPIISGITLVGDSYWNIDLKGGPRGKEKLRWRIPKYRSGDKMIATIDFLNIVAKKSNVQVSPPLTL